MLFVTLLLAATAVEAFTGPSAVSRPRVAALNAGNKVPGTKTYGQLITELSALPAYELPSQLQAEGLLSTVGTPQFFLAVAQMSDEATTEDEKEQLRAFAENLASTLSVVVEGAENQLDDASERLQSIVVTCAEQNGEFLWPLSPERREALAVAVTAGAEDGTLDEAVLTTIDAWAKKAAGDDLTGMVGILQKILQIYAAHICRMKDAEDSPAVACFDSLIAAARDMNSDVDEWNAILTAALLPDGDSPPRVAKLPLVTVLQEQVEKTVLATPNGSVTQRVLAEFLAEILNRIEAIAPKDDDEDPPATPELLKDLLGL